MMAFLLISISQKSKAHIIKRLPTVADAFSTLMSQRADAFVSARAAVEPFFRIHDVRNSTLQLTRNISFSIKISDSYVLIISRKYPELLRQVQETLDTMEQDGTIANIKQKWNLS